MVHLMSQFLFFRDEHIVLFCFCFAKGINTYLLGISYTGIEHSVASYSLSKYSNFHIYILSYWCLKALSFSRICPVISVSFGLYYRMWILIWYNSHHFSMCYLTEIRNYFKSAILPMPNIITLVHIPIMFLLDC